MQDSTTQQVQNNNNKEEHKEKNKTKHNRKSQTLYIQLIDMSILFCFPGCHFLQPSEQLLVRGWTDASVENGPGFKIIAGNKTATKRNGTTIGPTQYLIIENSLTGSKRVEQGPQLVFLGAHERIYQQKEAIALKHNEYVKIHDKLSGHLRVAQGEGLVFLQPDEVEMDSKST